MSAPVLSGGVARRGSRRCVGLLLTVLVTGILFGATSVALVQAGRPQRSWAGEVTAGGCVADVRVTRSSASVSPRSSACRVSVLTDKGVTKGGPGEQVRAIGGRDGVEVWLEDGEACDAVVWDEGWSLPAAVPGCVRP